MDLYCFFKVTNELEARVLEVASEIKFQVKAKLIDAPELGFMNENCTSLYEVTRSIDQFQSLVTELGLPWEGNCLESVHSVLGCLDQEPFYTHVADFFQNKMVNRHLANALDSDQPSWTNKLIRRLSMRSLVKEDFRDSPKPHQDADSQAASNPKMNSKENLPPTPVALLRSRTEGSSKNLLRRMTWNRGRVAPNADKETPVKKMSLLTRIGSLRHSAPKSEQRPSLVRSATTKVTTVNEAVEMDVFLETDLSFKLTVGRDITFDRLLRGIRNKAVLTGSPLPPAESLLLYYKSGGRQVSLTQRSVSNFFSLLLPHQVWVSINQNQTPDARFSWLDLNMPSRPASRRLSRDCEGLDFATSKNSYKRFQQLESLEDYLRTPCQTEAQNIMSNAMWGVTPELQLSVSSSSSISPAQLSPVLATEDFSFLVSQAMAVPEEQPEKVRPRSRPPLQRSITQHPASLLPKRVATLSQQTPPLVRQNSAPTKLDVSSLAKTRSNRIKLTVAINKDFIIKLDLPDYHQATYTSLRNRIATKFSKAGYPLRSLTNMTLTHCQFKNSLDATTKITDTKSLIKALQCGTHTHSISLLLVPNNLLAETSQNRGGIRWDHPLNLARV